MSFVVIEGDNGTGKDTQALKLEEKYGYSVITNFDEMKIINSEAKQHIGKEKVEKFLKYCNLCSEYSLIYDNSLVVRYWISTLAAAYADNIYTYDEVLKLQEKFCLNMNVPDIIICLWCNFDNRIKRINERHSDDFDDVTESRSIKYAWFLNQVKEKYNLNWVDIDTTDKSIEDVFNEISACISSLNNELVRSKES